MTELLSTTAPAVEMLALDEIHAFEGNSKAHPPEQVAALARSIREFGFTAPVLIDETGTLLAGHGRVMAAREVGLLSVPAIRVTHLTPDQKRAYVIADNRLTELGGWDEKALAAQIHMLMDAGVDVSVTGFDDKESKRLLAALTATSGKTDPDTVPPMQKKAVSRYGDVWTLGRHRVMCGDSTLADDVAALMAGQVADLLHADPPYGMGKEADGVINDNLYREKLDQFQMRWWAAFRPYLASNACAYIWGNAPDLWRLWYAGGLADSEKFELRNEIVWDKKSIAGMASPDMTQFPTASERCLFFQFGNQFPGNINTEDFPETWETIRGYMEGEAKAAGIKPPDVVRVCGCGMYSHWFTRSQFTLIPGRHYKALAAAYPGRFEKAWSALKSEWDRVKGAGRAVINGKLVTIRSYFENAHDTMRDVWEFGRVIGDDRHGHATPKPVAMMERVMRSSLPEGGLCIEPFGGSGSTLIGAESSGRVCYSMELDPRYCDVIVRRWQEFTGLKAVHAGDGVEFDEIATLR